VGTGYYAYYYDEDGHADFSHEWDAMRFSPNRSRPWICVVRPTLAHTEIVVMNGYFGGADTGGVTDWVARLRDRAGRVVAERRMARVPPRGTTRHALSDMFPDVDDLARRHGTIAFEAEGTNMMGPFSFVRLPGGDFNLHHFC
jgi:hypothetical protein